MTSQSREFRHTVVEVSGLQPESTPNGYEASFVPIPAALVERLKPLQANLSQEAPVFPSARSPVMAAPPGVRDPVAIAVDDSVGPTFVGKVWAKHSIIADTKVPNMKKTPV